MNNNNNVNNNLKLPFQEKLKDNIKSMTDKKYTCNNKNSQFKIIKIIDDKETTNKNI